MDVFKSLRAWRVQLSRSEFERELEQFLPQLYRTARGLTGDADEAEDLAHDVCVKAIAAFEDADLGDTSACRAWLSRIMLNTFRDRYRRDKRSPVDTRVELDNVIDFHSSREPGPDQNYQQELFRKQLDSSLQSLSVDVRIATVMHLVRGTAYKEIAQILECPIGTVMSRIAKGRRVLRQRLAAFETHPSDTTRAIGKEDKR